MKKENIKIKIGWKEFEFAWEILFKHMRKLQKLNLAGSETWELELEVILDIAEILCESGWDVRSAIDNLSLSEVEQFTKDFEKVMGVLQEDNNIKKK